jgi:hypothetical protein
MSDDDSFADGIRELLRNHNLSSSSFIRRDSPPQLLFIAPAARQPLPIVVLPPIVVLS